MLNQEQTDYIDSLKISHPNLPEETLKETLSGAGWVEAEITEALSRYSASFKPSAPVTPEPVFEPASVVTPAPKPATESSIEAKQFVPKEDRNREPLKPTKKENPPNTGTSPSSKPTPSEILAPASESSPKASVLEKTNKSEKPSTGEYKTSPQPIVANDELKKETKQTTKRVEPVVKGSARGLVVAGAVLLGILAVVAVGYYLYLQFGGSSQNLTNQNILRTTVAKLSQVESAEYGINYSLAVVPRDSGVTSFSETYPISEEVLEKYARDQDRLRDIKKIVSFLKDYEKQNGSYPDELNPQLYNTSDSMGNEYVYTAMSSKDYEHIYGAVPNEISVQGFELSVTFESEEMTQFVVNRFYNIDKYDVDNNTVTFDTRHISHLMYTDAEPLKPTLFAKDEFAELDNFVPANFSANIGGSGTFDISKESSLDARFGLAGEVVFGDAMFAFDMEALKKDDNYYAIINKLPSLFGSYGSIVGQWIYAPKEDLVSYGADSFFFRNILEDVFTNDEEKEEKYRKAVDIAMSVLETAEKHELVMIEGKPESMLMGDRKLTKYDLRINNEALIPFYTELHAMYPEAISDSVYDEMITKLESENTRKSLNYLGENTFVSLYFEKAGFPAMYEVRYRHVPSPEVEALKDKQIEIVLSISLKDINKTVRVEVPEETIPLDKAISLATGESMEKLQLEKQTRNIESIRTALARYKTENNSYPDTLLELTSIGKGGYLESYLNHISKDVYTGEDYEYENKGSDYSLRYTVDLTNFVERDDKFDYFYLRTEKGVLVRVRSGIEGTVIPKYYNGINEADYSEVSKVRLETLDSDGDGLSDTAEVIIGTDINLADTDSDGFSDGEEFLNGANPLGAGNW